MKYFIVIIMLSVGTINAQKLHRFSHDASLSYGYLKYMNSYNAPNGLIGNTLGAKYSLTKQYSDSDKELFLVTNFIAGGLNFNRNSYGQKQYNFYKASIGIGYNKLFYISPLKIVLKVGGIIGVDADAVFSTQKAINELNGLPNDFGRWQISFKPYLGASYTIKSLTFDTGLSTPLVGYGVSSQYPKARYFLVYNSLRPYLQPREIYFLSDMWDINCNFKTIYNKHKVKPFLVYSFCFFDWDNTYTSQKHIQHTFGVGIKF